MLEAWQAKRAKGFFEARIEEHLDLKRREAKRYHEPFLERKNGAFLVGDFVGAVLGVCNDRDARRFYEGYVEFLAEKVRSRRVAEYIARQDIGWCLNAGLNRRTARIWRRVLKPARPRFRPGLTVRIGRFEWTIPLPRWGGQAYAKGRNKR